MQLGRNLHVQVCTLHVQERGLHVKERGLHVQYLDELASTGFFLDVSYQKEGKQTKFGKRSAYKIQREELADSARRKTKKILTLLIERRNRRI